MVPPVRRPRRYTVLLGCVFLPAIGIGCVTMWLAIARANMPDVDAEARIKAHGGITQRMDVLPFWLPPRDQTWDELGHVWTLTYRGPITEPMLRDAADLSHLENLTLFGSPVAKDGVPHLARLRHLHHLILIDTDLSDADLIHLTGLRALGWAYLVNNPNITLEGVKRLQHELPWLYIAYYSGHHTAGVSPDYISDRKP